jgi:hypothetical protein
MYLYVYTIHVPTSRLLNEKGEIRLRSRGAIQMQGGGLDTGGGTVMEFTVVGISKLCRNEIVTGLTHYY